MARHVGLDDYFHASVGAVFLDVCQVFQTVGVAWGISPQGRKVGKGWYIESPGLSVCGVEMKAIEFVPREGVDCAEDVGDGVVAPGDVQVEASVGECGLVFYVYWGEGCIYTTVGRRVLVK